MPLNLQTNSCFSNSQSQVSWQGRRIINAEEFGTYLRGKVYERLIDEENRRACMADLEGLATTGMASDRLRQFIASEPAREPWEVGEAIAECLLADILDVKWPWNSERDKRSPRASLPGADLVGFLPEGDSVFLLLGEVKTSEDKNTPPGVMSGRTGMIHQLDQLANELPNHWTLIKWLYPRCQQAEFRQLYEKAIREYISTNGRALVLCGLLMRDTTPNELDLKNRAQALVGKVVAPTRIQLTAWYLPSPIVSWSEIATGGSG
jgi:hypothetical protein